VLRAALALPAPERLALAAELRASVEGDYFEHDDDLHAFWAQEVQRRTSQLRRGTEQALRAAHGGVDVEELPPGCSCCEPMAWRER
jgi:hypothetical protein